MILGQTNPVHFARIAVADFEGDDQLLLVGHHWKDDLPSFHTISDR
jgi:hypothetical protein